MVVGDGTRPARASIEEGWHHSEDYRARRTEGQPRLEHTGRPEGRSPKLSKPLSPMATEMCPCLQVSLLFRVNHAGPPHRPDLR